jgi:type II secretory ATPase GspE/PulE/Tfp pilus assembly ATPase PilB-like protein
MMGEIRHRDEAVASVELALEGILVVAALRVQMAAEGFGKLISLGADPKAVAEACVRSYVPRGRDVWEELVVTEWIRRMIAGGADAEMIHRYAVINERWQLAC